ncbi:uncharacterized protein BO80DRAFT_503105 [Aspergillus ibericus CBS 121593]|uniref:Ubiquitin 3 binding protein But2 C-terminal domain-containing protein n=1 Tax=Aspergillus ibericus CBS 121593 TaxID=1448316 RepID=A0A395GVS7_9EURO|nr:hypothetical protein BO80DRAFT_503105 [Aspergillus ibericus CBS 121593]RAK99615.1 hypothetical protein BO80DRAFT_503105 [Aspergillus ibericus CBS 121593]
MKSNTLLTLLTTATTTLAAPSPRSLKPFNVIDFSAKTFTNDTASIFLEASDLNNNQTATACEVYWFVYPLPFYPLLCSHPLSNKKQVMFILISMSLDDRQPSTPISASTVIDCLYTAYALSFPDGLGSDIETFTLKVQTTEIAYVPEEGEVSLDAGSGDGWVCEDGEDGVEVECVFEGVLDIPV